MTDPSELNALTIDPTTPPVSDPRQVHLGTQVTLARGLLACRFDPSGRYVVAGGMNTQLSQATVDWQQPATPLHVEGHKTWVAAVAFHPAGALLYSADYSGLLHGWTFPLAAESKPVWSQQAHQGWIRALTVSPDGAVLASGGNDQLVRLWSANDGQPIATLAGHESHVYSLAFHPGGHLVSADLQGIVKEWDISTRQPLRQFDAKRMFVQQANIRLGGVRALAFDAAGKQMACGGMSGIGSIGDGIGTATVMLFDWATGQATHVLTPKEPLRSFVIGTAFHPAGFVLAASGGLDQGTLLFWQPEPVEVPAGAAAPADANKPADPAKPAEATAFKPREQQTFHHFKTPQSGWGMDVHRDGIHIAVAHHDHALRYYALVAPPPAPAAAPTKS